MWQPTFNFGSNLIENWSGLGWSSFMISRASISTHQKPIENLITRIFPHLAQFKFNTFKFSLVSRGFSSLLIGSRDWMFRVVLWHSIRKHSNIKKVLNCEGNVLLIISSFRDKHALERGKSAFFFSVGCLCDSLSSFTCFFWLGTSRVPPHSPTLKYNRVIDYQTFGDCSNERASGAEYTIAPGFMVLQCLMKFAVP